MFLPLNFSPDCVRTGLLVVTEAGVDCIAILSVPCLLASEPDGLKLVPCADCSVLAFALLFVHLFVRRKLTDLAWMMNHPTSCSTRAARSITTGACETRSAGLVARRRMIRPMMMTTWTELTLPVLLCERRCGQAALPRLYCSWCSICCLPTGICVCVCVCVCVCLCLYVN